MSVVNNNLLLAADAGVSQYQISRSLRFNSADSAYLNRTPSVAGNRKTWTWAGWIKRSALASSSEKAIFIVGTSLAEGTYFNIAFTNDKIVCGTGAAELRRTTAVYRDVSAWYHLVVAVDTTQATAANRVKMYVNGTEVTAFDSSANPTLNLDTAVNSTLTHNTCRNSFNSANYFDGFLAECYLIDGQALTPSSFTETNATTGQLVPKAYTGTYGTNGFRLNFSNNSAATAATLGADSSGNGNNWTPNNLSVTAGAGNDSLTDTPTSYGTDTGAGGEVRGNYATLNPLVKAGDSTPTLTDGNLQLSNSSGVNAFGASSIAMVSGKWYTEFVATAGGPSVGIWIPIVSLSAAFYSSPNTNYRYNTGGGLYNSAGSIIQSYSTWTTGDVIGVALDLDNGKVFFSKNGVWQGSSNPTSGTNPAVTGLTGTWTFGGGCSPGNVFVANFGQRPFAYAAPSGFKALCDTNLPAPTIAKGSSVFDTLLWTGNGAARSITGLNYSPDFVWIKGRSRASSNGFLFDTVRGATNRICSSLTIAEASEPNTLTSFNSDGFSLGTDAGVGACNLSGDTWVGWCWDAGSSTVTNTAGTITSQVRANASAGFSVVTYTGTGANATVGHGLGVVPSMVIVKRRDAAGNWQVRHVSIAAANSIQLNLGNATAAATTVWNSTAPSSTVFSIGTSTDVNASASTYVAYCFAPVTGYSYFDTYTGNGSTDGPFVYLGFRARWIVFKKTDSSSDWWIYDTARQNYNVMDTILYANLSDAEVAVTSIFGRDILSNGFKVRNSQVTVNGNGATYIYAAFAENPFQFARAR